MLTKRAAAAQCCNTSHRRKRRVDYEKIKLLIVCPFANFHDNTELIMNSSCMSFCKASTPYTLILMAFLPSIKKVYCNQCFGGLAPSRRPHAIYNISPHLCLKRVSPVNELEPGRLLELSPGNKHCQFFALFWNFVGG